MNAKLKAQIDAVNREHAANPLDAGVARRWCLLAHDLGQFDKVVRCAHQFYARADDPLEKLDWARISASALFSSLSLEDALHAYTNSLNLLCDLGEAGQLPQPKRPNARTVTSQQAFASGDAERLLWTTCAALAEAGFAAYPYAGTLLGLEREGKLLPYDKDIDLGIWIEQHEDCSHWLQRQGWQRVTQLLPFAYFHAFVDRRTQLTLDLVGMRRLSPEGGVLGGFFLPGRSAEYQSPRLFPWFEIERRTSSAGQCWYIREPETLLNALYGDWRTPNPWWDGMVSDLCITDNTLLWRCFAYGRLVARWSAGEPERAWAYAHQILLRDGDDETAGRAERCLTQILQRINPGALHWPPLSTRSVLEPTP